MTESFENDDVVSKSICTALKGLIENEIRPNCQLHYNQELNKRKQDIFNRESIMNCLDDILISKEVDLVYEYLMNPIGVFISEFNKRWTS